MMICKRIHWCIEAVRIEAKEKKKRGKDDQEQASGRRERLPNRAGDTEVLP